MCIIWTRPSGTPAITDAALTASLNANADGFGLMAFVDGAVVAEKFGPQDRNAFTARYRALEATGATIVGHARFATHGAKTAEFAHPFCVTPEDGSDPYYLVHNGVLPIRTEQGASDTETYCRLVLALLPGEWWLNPALRYLVESDLGYSNKFALMTATGDVVLLNEKAGIRDGAMWFSNSGYKPYTPHAQWTPARQTAASDPKPSGTPPTPGSKRQQKRAAAAARKAARSAMVARNATAKPTLVTVEPSLVVPVRGPLMLRHGGHAVEALVDVDREKDGDYIESVECSSCGTFGDLFVIDGRAYMDLSHHAPTALVPYDALSAAGM